MDERKDEMGMSDMQYKDHLRAVVADLERIKSEGVSEKAEADIEAVIERFKATIES